MRRSTVSKSANTTADMQPPAVAARSAKLGTPRRSPKPSPSLADLRRDITQLRKDLDQLQDDVNAATMRLKKPDNGRPEFAETMSLVRSIAISSLAGRIFRSPPIAALAVGLISIVGARLNGSYGRS